MIFLKKLIFARALKFENGVFSILGVRGVILPSETFALFNLDMLNSGKKGEKALFEIGLNQGRRAIEMNSRVTKSRSMKVETMVQTVGLSGFGDMKVINANVDKGEAVFRVFNSVVPTELKKLGYSKKKKVDFFLKGIIVAAVEGLSKTSVTCEEVKCMAKGDEYCEFITKPVKKR